MYAGGLFNLVRHTEVLKWVKLLVYVYIYVVVKLQNVLWVKSMLCKNIVYCWLLLYENIKMHGPQNVRIWNTPNVVNLLAPELFFFKF